MQSSGAASAASLPNGDRFTTEVGDLLFSLQALLIREAQGEAAAVAPSAFAGTVDAIASEPPEAPVAAAPASVGPVAVAATPEIAPDTHVPPTAVSDPAFAPHVTVLPEAAPAPVPAAPPEPVLYDPSTGAPTADALRQEIERHGSRVSAALVALDVSPIGEIRATAGAIVAEAVLRAIVEAVPFAMRAQDQIYRTGLDELTLCVPETDLADAAVMSLRLQMAVKDVLVRRELPPVILSIRPYQQVAA
jgi:hypothetical protein